MYGQQQYDNTLPDIGSKIVKERGTVEQKKQAESVINQNRTWNKNGFNTGITFDDPFNAPIYQNTHNLYVNRKLQTAAVGSHRHKSIQRNKLKSNHESANC